MMVFWYVSLVLHAHTDSFLKKTPNRKAPDLPVRRFSMLKYASKKIHILLDYESKKMYIIDTTKKTKQQTKGAVK